MYDINFAVCVNFNAHCAKKIADNGNFKSGFKGTQGTKIRFKQELSYTHLKRFKFKKN